MKRERVEREEKKNDWTGMEMGAQQMNMVRNKTTVITGAQIKVGPSVPTEIQLS